MSIADFFKKDVVALPSGQESVFTEFKESKHQSQFATLGKVFAGIAIASAMVACGPSREEIDTMKADVPLKDKNEIFVAFDSTLLAKIDSLHFQAGQTMPNAVENGLTITWEQAHKSMLPRSQWSGKEYVTKDHAQARLEESRDSYTDIVLMPMVVSSGKSSSVILRPMPVTRYTYKPEFRDDLAKKIDANKAQKTLQTAQVVKSIQAVR